MEEHKLAEPTGGNRYTEASKKRTAPPEKQELKPVVKGKVRQRKKSLGEKFTETFLATDARSVGEYVIFDLLIPAAKRTFFDMFDGSLSMLLFGDRRSGYSGRRRDDYTPYNRYYRDERPPFDGGTRMRSARRPTTPMQVTQLEFECPEDAEEVLHGLEYQIQTYQVASVRDLYRLMDWDSDYTKDGWGWYSVATATIRQYRDCWLLTLPRPVQI